MKHWMTSVWLFFIFSATCFAHPEPNPYRVDMSVSINKIYGVNTIDQTYKVDGYLVASWHEPVSDNKPQTKQLFENAQVDEQIAQGIWIPTFEFINIIGKSIVANKRLVIAEDGTHIYNERFQGTFSTEMDFRRFPFDIQNFTLIMEPFSLEKDKLQFGKASVFMESPINANLSEWQMLGKPSATVSDQTYQHLNWEKHSVFSRLQLNVAAKRKPNYYLWQFILPLSLILIASWSVFWLDKFHERLMTSFTMMLTVVAYTFYTSSLLPRLPYTTFIERMIIMGYVSIFTAILLIVYVEMSRKKNVATQLLVRCRSIFPIVFVIVLSILIGVNSQI